MTGLRALARRASFGVFAAAALLACALPAVASEEPSLFRLSPECIGPKGAYGHEIDDLYRVILWLTTGAFVLTEGLLVFFVLKFRARPGGTAVYTHGNHKLEVIWTILPGAILFWLALYQFGTWKRIKIDRPDPSNGLVVQVLAKQFEWNFRYAGPDGKFGSDDDVIATNNLRVPVDTKVTVLLRSQDVLHAFYLPNLRLKQDTVPGLTISQWFESGKTTKQAREELRARLEATRATNGPRVEQDLRRQIALQLAQAKRPASNIDAELAKAIAEKSIEQRMPEWIDTRVKEFTFEIACAELCGIGHTTMKGYLHVLPKDEFWAWIDKTYVEEVHEFGPEDGAINKRWPKDQNKIEDKWMRAGWPAELKAKWPPK